MSHAGDAVARIDAALGAFAVGAQADDTAVPAVERTGVEAAAAASRCGAGERASRS